MTKKKLFVPADDEEILEVRPLIKLAEYEACIVRDKDGKDIFYYGKESNPNTNTTFGAFGNSTYNNNNNNNNNYSKIMTKSKQKTLDVQVLRLLC